MDVSNTHWGESKRQPARIGRDINRTGRQWVLWLVPVLLVAGCGKVTMQPSLSSSVGFEAFEQLGKIQRAPIHVAVLIDPKLRDLVFRLEHGAVIYDIAAGRAMAAKIVKLASYMFAEVSIVSNRDNIHPLLLNVGLQQEQPGLSVDVSRRAFTAMSDISTKVDFRLRAVLTDQGETVWVGTARVTDEVKTGGLAGQGGIDLSRAISETVDRATDRLVADLMRQVRRSESLRKYLEGRRR